jgi:hypothetical protein
VKFLKERKYIMPELSLDEALRLHLAEWVIVLLTLPDPAPDEAIRELAALEIISTAKNFLAEGQMRETIQNAVSPQLASRMQQLHEQLSEKVEPVMQTEAFTAQGSVGLGGLSEWDLLAMVIAGRKKGHLYKVQA